MARDGFKNHHRYASKNLKLTTRVSHCLGEAMANLVLERAFESYVYFQSLSKTVEGVIQLDKFQFSNFRLRYDK